MNYAVLSRLVLLSVLFSFSAETAKSAEFESTDIVMKQEGNLRLWSLPASFTTGTFSGDGSFNHVGSAEASYIVMRDQGVFDFATSAQLVLPKPVTNRIKRLELNDAGNLALVTYFGQNHPDQYSSVVDLKASSILLTIKNADVELSPSGNLVAVVREFGVEILDVKTQSKVSQLKTPGFISGGLFEPSTGFNFTNPLFGPHDDIILLRKTDGDIFLFDTKFEETPKKLADFGKGEGYTRFPVFKFAKDGDVLFSSHDQPTSEGPDDAKFTSWDTSTGDKLNEIVASSQEFSIAGFEFPNADDFVVLMYWGGLKIYNSMTGQEVADLKPGEKPEKPERMTFNSDQSQFLIQYGEEAQLWDWKTLKKTDVFRHPFSAYANYATVVAHEFDRLSGDVVTWSFDGPRRWPTGSLDKTTGVPNNAESVKADCTRFDGAYDGFRKYTKPSASRVSGCTPRNHDIDSTYRFVAAIDNCKVSFDSDSRNWSGRIDDDGNLVIDKFEPRPKSDLYIKGTLTNAKMFSGYCGEGQFSLKSRRP